jgi:hypothetical protein
LFSASLRYFEPQEARLLELVESGDMIGAITMARRLYASDLTIAKQIVEELVRKQTDGHR